MTPDEDLTGWRCDRCDQALDACLCGPGRAVHSAELVAEPDPTLGRIADALERIANSLETIGGGWGNAQANLDWQGKPWPRKAPQLDQENGR